MAIQTSWKTMDNKEGVSLNDVQATIDANTIPEYPAAPMSLGDRVQGNNGSEWLYVIASATVTAFNMIAINKNFGAINITTAVQASGIYTFGFVQCQSLVSTDGTSLNNVQPGQRFWALMKVAQGARCNINASISVALGAKLYVDGTTPGFLTTSTTTSNTSTLQIVGLFIAASATNGASVGTAYTVGEMGMYSYPFPAVLVSAQAASV